MAAYISFQPSDFFNTILYTGNGSTQSLTGVGFQPDMNWVKNRDTADNNEICSPLIGVEKYISPDNLKKYYIDNLKYYNNINNQQQYKENLEKLYKLK